MDNKEALRKRIRKYFQTPSPDFQRNRAMYDLRIAENLWGLSLWSEYTSMCLYRSLSDEVSTKLIAKRAEAEGKMLWEPSKEVGMQPWKASDAAGEEEHSQVEEAEKLLVITPGRCFDYAGNRVGRGGGYYDVLFSSLSIPYVAVALCYSFQVVDKIAVSWYDMPVHCIITDNFISVQS